MSLRRRVSVHWCSNPDAYIANEEDPSRLIRKNRNPQVCPGESASMGVDLNRNFPMYGESPGDTVNECGETYNGGSPFSEPESLASKKLAESNNFTFALSIHSFGLMLILPTGLTPDDRKFCDEMRPSWIEKYGDDEDTVGYNAPGTIESYWYREHNILSMCLEVGTSFWPEHEAKDDFLSKTTPLLRNAVTRGGCSFRVVRNGTSVTMRNDGRDRCLPLKVSSGVKIEDVGEIPARSSRDVAVNGSTICVAEYGVPFCLCDRNGGANGGALWKTRSDAICKSLLDSENSDESTDDTKKVRAYLRGTLKQVKLG